MRLIACVTKFCSSPPLPPLSSFLRMECLLSLQRYDECLAMINHELLTDESNPTLYILRAQINILFGNVSHSSTLHLSSLPPLLSLPSLPTCFFYCPLSLPSPPPQCSLSPPWDTMMSAVLYRLILCTKTLQR